MVDSRWKRPSATNKTTALEFVLLLLLGQDSRSMASAFSVDDTAFVLAFGLGGFDAKTGDVHPKTSPGLSGLAWGIDRSYS